MLCAQLAASPPLHAAELLWLGQSAFRLTTPVGGEPVGFVIELENGLRIYHMATPASSTT